MRQMRTRPDDVKQKRRDFKGKRVARGGCDALA